MLLLLLIFLPLAAAIVAALLPSRAAAKTVALVAAVAELGITLACIDDRTAVSLPWIPSLGISFAVGFVGLSSLLVLLTNALLPLILLSANRADYNSRFYALVLLMQAALVGVFTAGDGFLFYVFWELALIPIYFICLGWGEDGRARITLKFFIYTMAGSLFMLLGLVYLYLHTATHTFAWDALIAAGHSLDASHQSLVFWAFFVAFAIKMPIFPFHTWQPDTYTNAPAQGTMLLAGVMLKMGIFGAMHWLIPAVPMAVADWSPLVVILSVIGVVYASIIALQQRDMKRLVAYSSIAHVGLIAAGVFATNAQAWNGAAVQMLAHGFNVVGLFYCIDLIERRTGTRNLDRLGGLATADPAFATLFFVLVLGTIAMPLTNGFVGEFLLLMGLSHYSLWAAAFAATTMILGAVYMLRLYRASMFGEVATANKGRRMATPVDVAILLPLAMTVVIMGFFPAFFLHTAAPAVDQLLALLAAHK